jgi:hypothetical protein
VCQRELAAKWGNDLAAEELVGERKRFASECRALQALRKTAARLGDRCREEGGLAGEASLINERLSMQVQEDGK